MHSCYLYKLGLVVQTVKDVLQTLVDDDLVELEKIGATNFYWAFPSKAYRAVRLLISKCFPTLKILQKVNKVERLKEQVTIDTAAIAELQQQRDDFLVGREQTVRLDLLYFLL